MEEKDRIIIDGKINEHCRKNGCAQDYQEGCLKWRGESRTIRIKVVSTTDADVTEVDANKIISKICEKGGVVKDIKIHGTSQYLAILIIYEICGFVDIDA